jgi:(p)ppGpp synthase/HD superfamily hydrolase
VDDPITEYFEEERRNPLASIIRIEDDGLESSQRSSDGLCDDEVSRIVLGAARLKRAEIMAHTVLGNRSLTKEEASRLRELLLSVMDDWRSLGIRAVACQFRLEGILRDTEHGVKQYVRTPELVRMAKEAMHVYAPLAQRLGMQRLKAKIEDNAFRVLYRRQYRAASALYRQNGAALKAMSRYLEGQVAQLLLNDDQLMSQLEDIQINSRVKEPYSSWRKLVKRRFIKTSQPSLTGSSQRSIAPSTSSISELSILDINDGVALRVILQARKHSPDELDDATRARERLLCYYVQHLLRSQWMGSSKTKDYIQFPKDNGYQSLHYNSFISSQGQDWPFEVQVRSKEMHQIAEHGVAAHWDYKLSTPSVAASLPPGEVIEPVQVPLVGVNMLDVSLPMVRHIGQTSYVDALVNAKDELVQNKVFVFFASSAAIANEGEILSLPLGARVGDALAELEGDVRVQIRTAKSAGYEEWPRS